VSTAFQSTGLAASVGIKAVRKSRLLLPAGGAQMGRVSEAEAVMISVLLQARISLSLHNCVMVRWASSPLGSAHNDHPGICVCSPAETPVVRGRVTRTSKATAWGESVSIWLLFSHWKHADVFLQSLQVSTGHSWTEPCL